MSSNIFFKFDYFKNLYINGSTFDIQANVDNLQVQLNTDIDCVAYIDVSLHYFNNVFSYAVADTTSTTDISAIIFSGGPNDIRYYVDFKRPYDVSKNTYTDIFGDTWHNVFTWFNPAYARCPPRSMKTNDITIDNRIVHSAYPINGNIVPRIIAQDTNKNNTETDEIIVGKDDQVYMERENTITRNGKDYYTNCLLLRTKEVGIIPVNLFVPMVSINNSIELSYYNDNNTENDKIQRILSSDRVIDEYIRYLSYCLTDSPNNVGLISNYYEIQKQLSDFCGSDASGVVMSRLKNKLLDLDVSSNITPRPIGRRQDNSGNWYVDNSYNQSLNITRTLLIQASQLGRGYEITAEDIAKGNRVPFKFIAGDKITFTFTINPPEFTGDTERNYRQPGWTDFQEILIKPRKYRIFANIIN